MGCDDGGGDDVYGDGDDVVVLMVAIVNIMVMTVFTMMAQSWLTCMDS